MSEEVPFKLPVPGPDHALLKPFEGTFVSEVKMWMGPGEPSVTTGKMINSFRLGGLYLHQDYQGDPSDGPFPAFEGQGFWGYNLTSGKFEGFWIDNISSAMQMETGMADETGKVFEMRSEFVAPGAGVTCQKRTVFTVVNNDHHTMESYITGPDGRETKNMVIDYRRI